MDKQFDIKSSRNLSNPAINCTQTVSFLSLVRNKPLPCHKVCCNKKLRLVFFRFVGGVCFGASPSWTQELDQWKHLSKIEEADEGARRSVLFFDRLRVDFVRQAAFQADLSSTRDPVEKTGTSSVRARHSVCDHNFVSVV